MDPPHARRLVSPDAYTPKHLTETIAASRGALEGERKQVTVLFADLKGSMELMAGLACRRDEAVSLAVEALRLSREHKERAHQAYASRLLAEIASHDDPPDPESADHYYREAITLAEELGMWPLLAHCHVGLGRPCRRTGNRQTTEEHLTAAARLYQEMDMTLWLERLDAG